MQILGNTVERSSGPEFGNGSHAFDVVTEKVIKGLEQLWALHQHGLSAQSAQALARVLASTKPQHVLRSTRVTKEQAEKYDRVAEKIWDRILAPKNGLSNEQRMQLHLPIQEGGFSVGGASLRAEAAYVAGNMAAWSEIQAAAGAVGVEALQRLTPPIVDALDKPRPRP